MILCAVHMLIGFMNIIKKLSDRELLANQMRHSVMTSQRNYLKVDLKNDAEEYKVKDKQELIQEIIKLKNELDKYKNTSKEDIN